MSTAGTVYLIDNDEAERNRLTRLLARAGYVAMAYASVEAFLSDLPAKEPACVVLDSATADLSAPDFKKAFAAKGVSFPVLFLTSKSDAKARRRARAFGAAGFYAKPVDGAALLDAIDWALETHNDSSQPG